MDERPDSTPQSSARDAPSAASPKPPESSAVTPLRSEPVAAPTPSPPALATRSTALQPGGSAPTVLIVVLSAALVLGCILRTRPVICPNDQSRWNTVWSLVEKGTYVINDAPWIRTIDKVRVVTDGEERFYSSKPPLFPTVMAGLYWSLKHTLGLTIQAPETNEDGTRGRERHVVATRTIIVLVNWVPLVLFLIFFARVVHRLTDDPYARVYCTAAAGLGTYLSIWCITINNHVIAGFATFFCIAAALAVARDRRRGGIWFVGAGLFGAIAACTELPAALFGIGVFLWMLIIDWRRTLIFFVPAATVPCAGFIVTNYLATGGLMPFYAGVNSELYRYEGSYWSDPQGIDAIHEPAGVYMFNMLLGHHGFFSLTPIFLLGLIGIFILLRRGPNAMRVLALGTVGLTAAMVLFYTFEAPHRNYGGTCQGMRWLFWLIPLWLVFLPAPVEKIAHNRFLRGVSLVLLAVSALSVGYAANNGAGPWGRSWLHNILYTTGVTDY